MIKLIDGKKESRFFMKPVTLEKREGAADARTIVGYAALFNSVSVNMGWFKEQIAPGAFDKTDLSDVVATFNHNPDLIQARTKAKNLIVTVDNFGLKYEFEAPNTTAGNDLLENVRCGNIQSSSFTFQVRAAAWELLQNDPDGAEELRTITDFSIVHELAPVVFPAYEDTEVALRSFTEERSRRNKPIIMPMYNRNIAELELALRKRK